MSAEFGADFFDGRSSRRRPVRVGTDGDRVSIRGEDVTLVVERSQAVVHPRIGTTPVRIALPDGGLLVAPDFSAVDASLGVPRGRTLAHRLESHVGMVVAAFLGIVVGVWFAYHDGIPWASEKLAQRVPSEVEGEISEDALATADAYLLQPSHLDDGRKDALRREFARLVTQADAPPGARLEFRDSRLIPANAFTLPSGIIVVTDKLVYILDDRQVAAVLAHELGHAHHRHGLRLLLANSMHALFVMAVFGDASGLSGVAATLPTLLVNSGYSRAFESEADRFAFDLLKRIGRSPADFAAAIRILEALENPESATKASRWGYFTTHPESSERIGAAYEAAKR